MLIYLYICGLRMIKSFSIHITYIHIRRLKFEYKQIEIKNNQSMLCDCMFAKETFTINKAFDHLQSLHLKDNL